MSSKEMVQQVIKYSDGTETVINYKHIPMDEDIKPEEAEAAVDAEEATEASAVEAEEAAPEEKAAE